MTLILQILGAMALVLYIADRAILTYLGSRKLLSALRVNRLLRATWDADKTRRR